MSMNTAAFGKLHKTRFAGNGEALCYCKIGKGWQFIIVRGSEGSQVGQFYASKDEILSDLYRYATEYGFNGVQS